MGSNCKKPSWRLHEGSALVEPLKKGKCLPGKGNKCIGFMSRNCFIFLNYLKKVLMWVIHYYGRGNGWYLIFFYDIKEMFSLQVPNFKKVIRNGFKKSAES